MNRNTSRVPASQPWIGAAVTLALAVAAGVIVAQMLMSPPASEQRQLAIYFAVAGAITLIAGWMVIRVTERSLGLSLQTKAFFGAITGTCVALINVLVIAQLMFISTAHDLRLLLAVVVFSGVVTVSFSLWVASTASQRIVATTRSINAIASGDYSRRLSGGSDDELGRLADDVNALAGRLEQAEHERVALDYERKELTTAISHDLRTPLTSMRAMLEAIDDGVVLEPSEVRRYHATLRREVDRLSAMVDDLLELARIDAGALQLTRQPVPLQEIAEEVVEAMEAEARNADVSLDLAVENDPPAVYLDGSRIERAVFNLVCNALQHTPSGGRVEVRVRSHEGGVELSVGDTGTGVDCEDLPKIWERFYRADQSRTRSTTAGDGAGLGLAIVRGIVEAHGGVVHASSPPSGGALFTMRLPGTV